MMNRFQFIIALSTVERLFSWCYPHSSTAILLQLIMEHMLSMDGFRKSPPYIWGERPNKPPYIVGPTGFEPVTKRL
jgi:hypothetical protein